MQSTHRRAAILFLVLLACAVVAAAQSSRAGVTIGCFCMDGIRGQRHPNEIVQTPDGFWTPWTYRYSKVSDGGAARFFIFDRPVPAQEMLLGCDEVAANGKAAGIHLLLSGTLNKLNLKALVFQATAGGENRFQVDENELDAELGHVTSGAQRIGGGSMKLTGARLFVSNPTRLLALAEKMTGTVEVEAWNRSIAGATMQLPGGATFLTTLAPVDPQRENVAIRVDVETGKAQLWRGHLRGAVAQPIHAPTLIAAALTLDEAQFGIREVFVNADMGMLNSTLADISGKAARATLSRPTAATKFTNPLLQWKRVDSAVEQSVDQLKLTELSLAGAAFRSAAAELRTSSDAVAMSGAADVRFETLTTTAAVGRARWTRPEVPALPFVLPAGAVDDIDIDFAGDLDAPRLRGNAAARRFAIGAIAIRNRLTIPFDLLGGGAELRFPLKFAFGPVGAGVTVHAPDQAAAITATLANADADGTIVVTWPDLRQSHVEVPADRFHLTLVNTVATKPLLAGTAPAFGSAQVGVMNSTAINASEKSTGFLKLTSDVLVLGQPVLRVGDKGHESPSTLQLTASGTAAAQYDLESGKMSLLKGKFRASDVEFALLDPNGALDLAGTVIAAPHVTLHELSIDIDEEQQPKVSHAGLSGLSINASRVARPRSPEHPKEVTWEAIPERPLVIADAEASKTSISDTVSLQQISIRGLDFAFRDATAQFGEGFNVDQAGLTLKAKSIATVDDGANTTYTFDDASFGVHGRLSTSGQVHINDSAGFALALNVSGRSDHLSGSGSAKLGGFTGSDVTTMPVDLKDFCAINLPIEYNFAVGGADMQVSANDGRFEGDASLAPLGLLVHSTSGASCNTPSEELVISEEKKISTTGICCCPLDTCEWSVTIPKVAFRFHKRFHVDALGTTAMLTNPRAHLGAGRFTVCNLGAITLGVPTVIAGAINPEIETAFPGADNIINGIIGTAFGLAESAIATGVANGAGFFASTTLTGGGNALCLIR